MTYPRTDARVLSTAIAKEIGKNIGGLKAISAVREYADTILAKGLHKNIAKTRYTNDKQITDHYAIIPTGQGFSALKNLSPMHTQVYSKIVRRFLSIFYPPGGLPEVYAGGRDSGRALLRRVPHPGRGGISGNCRRSSDQQQKGAGR